MNTRSRNRRPDVDRASLGYRLAVGPVVGLALVVLGVIAILVAPAVMFLAWYDAFRPSSAGEVG